MQRWTDVCEPEPLGLGGYVRFCLGAFSQVGFHAWRTSFPILVAIVIELPVRIRVSIRLISTNVNITESSFLAALHILTVDRFEIG